MASREFTQPGRKEVARIENRRKACMIEFGESTVCVDASIPILNLLGKKYTSLIIGVVGNSGEKKNFNEILRDIPFSSTTIISGRLKDLSEAGIIARIQRSDGISYSLTQFGKELRSSLLPLITTVEKFKSANR